MTTSTEIFTDIEDNVPSEPIIQQCKYCSKKYKLLTSLKKHEACCTEIEESEVNTQNTKKFSCNFCGQKFKYAKALEKHERFHKGKHPYWCKQCMLNFATYEEETLHKSNKHQRKDKTYKCKLCENITFEIEEEYLYHINNVHKGKFDEYYICSDCGKQFKTRGELTHHNKSKCGTVKQYICKICNQKLMTAGSLYNHLRWHKGKRSSMCSFCGKMFLTAGQLKVHERSHTQDKAFICKECGKGFCHRQSLITHNTLHSGIKPYLCENCNQSFSCIGNLIKHRRTHTDTCGSVPLTTHRVNNLSTKMKIKLNTPETVKLKMVEKEREIEEKLAAYKEKIKKSKVNKDAPVVAYTEIVKCEPFDIESECDASDTIASTFIKCENLTTDAMEFMNEIESIHVINKVEDGNWMEISNSTDDFSKIEADAPDNDYTHTELYDNGAGKYKMCKIVKRKQQKMLNQVRKVTCQYCKKEYTNTCWLLKHEKLHVNKINQVQCKSNGHYKCSCCKIGFKTREECKMHQQNMHSDILTCQDCDKLFANIDSLRSHQNIFHKGQPKKVYLYVCEKCGLQFRQKAFLNHHEENNCGTTGPLFKCHICEKGFNNIHTRQSHLRVHDPKKKFLCKFCGKNFRWKGQLKVHERSHTGEKPFKCLYCPKAFGYRESLITHSSLHTGIKPHLCQGCGSRFSCIGNLIKHRATHASTCGLWYKKN